MKVTFTNITAAENLFLSQLYRNLAPGEAVQTRRTMADLEGDQPLKQLVTAGKISLAFLEETGDDVALGFMSALKSYTNATRPAATAVPTFSAIWNTDDNAPNWSDGAAWRDSAGVVT
jgi:hypothetical protein